MASYELQEFKDLSNLRINKICFIPDGKDLHFNWLTIADVFRDGFLMFICDLRTSYIFVGVT